jgi:uncharacterized protein (TIGR02246 family)
MDSLSKHANLIKPWMKAALLVSLFQAAFADQVLGLEVASDLEALTNMVTQRERAMQAKNASLAMEQFSDDATWINSQGYYFEGKAAVAKFHAMLTQDPQRDYRYEAGTPRIRLLDSSNAIVYYSWRMTWFERENPEKVIKPEVGLMTLNAQKRDGKWYWVAITVQHTPWFYQSIEPEHIGE